MKNIRIQLIQWNLYHKKQNQYAYVILKLKLSQTETSILNTTCDAVFAVPIGSK